MKIAIVAAKRTPQGRFLGALADRSAVDLAVEAGRAASAGFEDLIDQVILGQILTAGCGLNAGRQLAYRLQLPAQTAYTVNMACASGIQAVILGAMAIAAGQARAVLCGGSECMSQTPHLATLRQGRRYGDLELIDGLSDGLRDPFLGRSMGDIIEDLVAVREISRLAQDQFALRSHALTALSVHNGHFREELVSLDELSSDEPPRPDTTLAKLNSLRPAFREDGTITAGNASSLSDGAAMILLADLELARERDWEPLALIEAWEVASGSPELMGLGPVWAIRRLARHLGSAPLDLLFDWVEINEAFAGQVLACLGSLEDLGLGVPHVNPDGGAIALGHPIGASGARLIVHCAHAIRAGRATRALVSLGVGAGMGVAMSLTAPDRNL